jgi:AraC-like DNA-binding protein
VDKTVGAADPKFWRDEALPFVEMRSIRDGRDVHYARHAHETFSIGIVTDGRCNYLNGRKRERIGAGSVVIMNPGDAHSCNPACDANWAYRMLYLDVSWLTAIQEDLGVSRNHLFRPFSTTATTQSDLYLGLARLCEVLSDQQADPLQKQGAAVSFIASAQRALSSAPAEPRHGHAGVERAAEFIAHNYARSLKLEEICAAANLSPSHLIRAFKKKHCVTPHAYLVNRRVEFCRAQLRRGRPLAEVALAAGFSDQAHMQRSFKRFVAATPGQYRA